ncbi:MAG: hypothetical protein HY565_02805 [Candidatus Kerfeldbacteria bacterium]|nr:hypothetical protein [Candidatus Kerfeldbacteria bacterium]
MTTHPTLRLTELFHNTASFIVKHFLILLVANAVPLFLSYAVVWLTVGAVVSQLQSISTVPELTALFSASSPVTYTLVMTAVLVLAINIMGWVAGPLVTIEQDKIKLLELFPKAAKYFWSYFVLAIMVIAAAVVLEVAVFLIITIIITLVGFIDTAMIATWENYLVSIIPDIALIILMVSLMFAPYFLIDQKLTAWQATQRSVSLVWHHFGTVMVRFLLLAMIIIVISFVLQFIPFFGGALAYLVGSILLTVYNYYLYKGLTSEVDGA